MQVALAVPVCFFSGSPESMDVKRNVSEQLPTWFIENQSSSCYVFF